MLPISRGKDIKPLEEDRGKSKEESELKDLKDSGWDPETREAYRELVHSRRTCALYPSNKNNKIHRGKGDETLTTRLRATRKLGSR